MSQNNNMDQMRRPSRIMYLEDLSTDEDHEKQPAPPTRKPPPAVSPVEQVEHQKIKPSLLVSPAQNDEPTGKKTIVMKVNELDEIPRRKSIVVNNSKNLNESRFAEIEQKIQKKLSVGNGNRKIKVIHHLEEESDDDTTSTITEDSGVISPTSRSQRKLLSGFHPYHDEETDMLALQCSTCCIGCWRDCSDRCTGCENFISCPIYCWCGVFFPFFIMLLAGFILTLLYATGKLTG